MTAQKEHACSKQHLHQVGPWWHNTQYVIWYRRTSLPCESGGCHMAQPCQPFLGHLYMAEASTWHTHINLSVPHVHGRRIHMAQPCQPFCATRTRQKHPRRIGGGRIMYRLLLCSGHTHAHTHRHHKKHIRARTTTTSPSHKQKQQGC
jgi:hypothetical protein